MIKETWHKAKQKTEGFGLVLYIVLISFFCMQAICQDKNIPFPFSDELAFSLFLPTVFYGFLYYIAGLITRFYPRYHFFGFYYIGLISGFAAAVIALLSPATWTVSAANGLEFMFGSITGIYLPIRLESNFTKNKKKPMTIQQNGFVADRYFLQCSLQIAIGIFFGLAPYFVIQYYVSPGWKSFFSLLLAGGIFISGLVVCRLFLSAINVMFFRPFYDVS